MDDKMKEALQHLENMLHWASGYINKDNFVGREMEDEFHEFKGELEEALEFFDQNYNF